MNIRKDIDAPSTSLVRFHKELEKLGYKPSTRKMYGWHASMFETALRKKFKQEDRPVTRFLKNVQARPVVTKKFASDYLKTVRNTKGRDYFRQACRAVLIYMRLNIHPTIFDEKTMHGIQAAG